MTNELMKEYFLSTDKSYNTGYTYKRRLLSIEFSRGVITPDEYIGQLETLMDNMYECLNDIYDIEEEM